MSVIGDDRYRELVSSAEDDKRALAAIHDDLDQALQSPVKDLRARVSLVRDAARQHLEAIGVLGSDQN